MNTTPFVPVLLAALLTTTVALAETRPVILELFTSEGCSSCPAADRLIERLARSQPVPGIEILALGMHVDYWDDLGWKDPFASASFSERQHAYAREAGSGRIYTPQLIVDGQRQVLGSDERGVLAAVAAEKAARLAVRAEVTGGEVAVDIAPAGTAVEGWVAITESGLASEVRAGENAGRRLAHAPIVRRLISLGPVDPARGLHVKRRLDVPAGWRREGLRVVAFAQSRGPGAILGAATAVVP